jgi:cysteine-S-conjugate beta-lyase
MPKLGHHPLKDILVHSGRESVGNGRLVNPPIEIGSTVLFDTLAAFEAARDRRYESGNVYYGRYGTPASFHLESLMCELEGAFGCTIVSSGVAAITLALLGTTKAGDHMLVADHVYGNTRGFCDQVLGRTGVEVEYYDPMVGEAIEKKFRDNTSVVMFEAPGSGTFEFPDIQGIAKTASRNGVMTILDGTWATPVFCRPLGLGVDVVVHSGSKYLSGHSDGMIGFIACNEKTYTPIRKTVMAVGDKPGAQEVHLALRGLRTLDLRMRRVHDAGIEVATWLRNRPKVAKVLHPIFDDCPGHEYWRRDFSGAAGLFGVIFKSTTHDKVRRFVDHLKMFGIGVSWGGYESLVLPVKPVRTATNWSEEGPLVRFNIGFEDTASLIDDLEQALPLL